MDGTGQSVPVLELVEFVEHPRRADIGRVRRDLAVHAAVLDAMKALDQLDGAVQELPAEGSVVLVDAVADLQRQGVGGILAQVEPHARVHHALRIARDMAKGIDHGGGAGEDAFETAEPCNGGALAGRHREADRRHVAEDGVARHVLDGAAQHQQHGVGVGIDEAGQHRLAAAVDDLPGRHGRGRVRRSDRRPRYVRP